MCILDSEHACTNRVHVENATGALVCLCACVFEMEGIQPGSGMAWHACVCCVRVLSIIGRGWQKFVGIVHGGAVGSASDGAE